MTLNLKCCVGNQSNLFYGNFNWFSNKFSKSITILGRNLNKNSITLINYLGNKLIILHVFTCTQSYIYICTRMYTMLIYGVHNSIRMNTTLTKEFFGEDADFFIGKCITISDIKELDRERSAVEVTFEVKN